MENKPLELKLYSPITGHLMEDDQDDFDAAYYDYEGTPLSPYEMTAFEAVVKEAIEDEKLPEEAERGLMEYYYGHEPASVDAKVLSAFVDAEVYENKLWGVLKCTLKEPLTNEEIAALKEYASGQYSDGYGEGFEQRERKTEYGDLYVHFWHSGDDYSILTEQELKGPEMERQRKKPKAKKQERAR